MEKMIYWIKKTVKRDKKCRCLCLTCKYFDECKSEGGE